MRQLVFNLVFLLLPLVASSRTMEDPNSKSYACDVSYNLTHINSKKTIPVRLVGNSPRQFFQACWSTVSNLFQEGWVPSHKYTPEGDLTQGTQEDIYEMCSPHLSGACD